MMQYGEARTMLEALCQQARNRMRSRGLSHVIFRVTVCTRKPSALHVQVQSGDDRVANFHAWDKSYDYPPSMYEQAILNICNSIEFAEDVVAIANASLKKAGFRNDTSDYIH